MSVGARGIFSEPFKEMLFPVIRAAQGRLASDPEESFVGDFREKMARHHQQLAAVILEPLIQGGEPRARWETISSIHRTHLDNLAGREIIKDLRSCGTVAAIEFDSADGGYLDAPVPEIHRTALENGVLLRPLGNISYVLPPYSIGEEQLHRVWNVVEKCIAVAEAESVRGRRPDTQPIAPIPGG